MEDRKRKERVSIKLCAILIFIQYITLHMKIQSRTINLSTRLWGTTTELVGFIPQSLMLRSVVLE